MVRIHQGPPVFIKVTPRDLQNRREVQTFCKRRKTHAHEVDEPVCALGTATDRRRFKLRRSVWMLSPQPNLSSARLNSCIRSELRGRDASIRFFFWNPYGATRSDGGNDRSRVAWWPTHRIAETARRRESWGGQTGLLEITERHAFLCSRWLVTNDEVTVVRNTGEIDEVHGALN
jgi:hypothetical protein